MPRPCSVCNLEEFRLTIDARLRSSESIAALAREFSVSEDAMARHAKNHVRNERKRAANESLVDRLNLLWDRLDEAYMLASRTENLRGVLDALTKLGSVLDTLGRIQPKESGTFETMTLEQKVDHIRHNNNGELFRATMDAIVAETDQQFETAVCEHCGSLMLKAKTA